MNTRTMADLLYAEKHNAEQELRSLQEVKDFAACPTPHCHSSRESDLHDERIRATRLRIDFALNALDTLLGSSAPPPTGTQ